MGGEMSAFLPSDSVPIELTGGGIYVFPYDTSFSRCGLRTTGNSYLDTSQFAALTECWTHMSFNHRSDGGGTYYPLYWLNASDTQVLRMKHVTSGTETVSFESWDGAAWVAAGASISLPLASAMQVIDVRFVVNSATGTVALYVAGTERINSTVDLSAIASIRKLRVAAGVSGFSSESRFSQVVIADESTIGFRLGTCYVSAAGATSSWTGAYTDIDETVYSDADFINSGSANQVSTFAQTAIPTLTGYTVRAIAVTARAKRNSASGPQNTRMALRSSGTDYFSGSDIALGLGYTPVQTIWETNPATSAAWVNTAIAALQPGVKSIT